MKKHKVSKVVWFDETEERLPEIRLHCIDMGQGELNSYELSICCSFKKPKQNAKRIRITVEEV